MQGLFEDAPFLTHVQSGQGLELDLLDMSLQDFISAASPSPSSTSSAQLRKQAPPVPGGLYDPDPKMRGKNALSAKANREKKRAEQEALLARLARFEQLEKAWAAEKAGLMAWRRPRWPRSRPSCSRKASGARSSPSSPSRTRTAPSQPAAAAASGLPPMPAPTRRRPSGSAGLPPPPPLLRRPSVLLARSLCRCTSTWSFMLRENE